MLSRAIGAVEGASFSVALDDGLGGGVFHAYFFCRAVDGFVFGHDKVDQFFFFLGKGLITLIEIILILRLEQGMLCYILNYKTRKMALYLIGIFRKIAENARGRLYPPKTQFYLNACSQKILINL